MKIPNRRCGHFLEHLDCSREWLCNEIRIRSSLVEWSYHMLHCSEKFFSQSVATLITLHSQVVRTTQSSRRQAEWMSNLSPPAYFATIVPRMPASDEGETTFLPTDQLASSSCFYTGTQQRHTTRHLTLWPFDLVVFDNDHTLQPTLADLSASLRSIVAITDFDWLMGFSNVALSLSPLHGRSAPEELPVLENWFFAILLLLAAPIELSQI
ncbi:hypothetical protein EDD37DRAFT_128996 [Exophiala viscosa]|uniref:Uncharacterized protein n=1 Tax=Exophiala viscosa TaxID=2486360 RepID=A0AAN6DX59_9EURO|nr:hypothetical protein EDD36DRAFT_220319 [Exophiala viscosa]KAI1621685.1 hypothetical protein EDD37DRAFT_128996 [Exophiala viscosa]